MKETRTLREINEHVLRVLDALGDSDNEADINTLLGALSELRVVRAEKLDACAAYRLSQKDAVHAIETEIARLRERKEQVKRASERLDTYLIAQMRMGGFTRHKSDLYSISVCQSPAKVVITDENAIPQEFKREVTEVKIDKTAIRQAIQAGHEVAGAALETDNVHLRIK